MTTKPKQRPDISVVIVNWNAKDFLRLCIDSIKATFPPITYSIIVADNASTDGSPDMIAEEYPEVLLLRSQKNLGYTGASNLGMSRADSEYILLINPDLEFKPGAVAAMIDFMQKNEDVGMVGPKLLCEDGSLQYNGRKFPTFWREFLGVTRLYKFAREYHDKKLSWGRSDFDKTVETDEISGACMLTRKSVIDKVGMMDERFFMYYEDVDWCLRVRKAGWRIFYIAEAVVVHFWMKSACQIGVVKSYAKLYRSQYLYWKKHHGMLPAVILRIFSYGTLGIMRTKYLAYPLYKKWKAGRNLS